MLLNYPKRCYRDASPVQGVYSFSPVIPVIPVKTGIYTSCFTAKTALDCGTRPTVLDRNDDKQIALAIMK